MSEDHARASTARVWLAVRLYAEGRTLEEIASRLPDLRWGAKGAVGVCEEQARAVLAAGLRLLLGRVLRDERPEGLPEELWPPPTVREEVRSARGRAADARRRRALRAWIESRRPEGGRGGNPAP